MLYYKDNKWHLSEFEVNYIDGEEVTKPVGIRGKAGWNELAEKHSDIEVIKFTKLDHAPEELNRLKEINSLNIPDGFSSVLAGYVKSGTFPDKPNHVLKDLEFSKVKEENKRLVAQTKALSDSVDFTDDVIQEMIMNTL